MSRSIHLYLSSRESLQEQRNELEKELSQNKDTKDSDWGVLTRRGAIKSQLADVNDEIAKRLSND